ncbi:lasso peptide biosynthesis B2 protein [Actinomadura rubrisoli]|uniref:Lasso peptide biosynthesis B2 protein n=1 Tax=Actinomadura rubrisoli TaxID=2530368 RepID=A0A4R5C1Z0_9ACTN|nr:lasso peptide biosynthesis B2 protein [Actinomadura rubrisoli]TDD91840.1 lasso peptide biosynthesis B2 protein [Actinomadura rubrisoli]
MTMLTTSESPVALSRRLRVTACAAVAVARLLVALSPRRLQMALRLLRTGSRPANTALALNARQAVVTVSARCAGQGCLQRSVATAVLCRLHGGWPDWCTGVRSRPFRAHAWVEVDGAAIGEIDDMALFRTTMSVRHPGAGKLL